jgi:hypothetical protein
MNSETGNHNLHITVHKIFHLKLIIKSVIDSHCKNGLLHNVKWLRKGFCFSSKLLRNLCNAASQYCKLALNLILFSILLYCIYITLNTVLILICPCATQSKYTMQINETLTHTIQYSKHYRKQIPGSSMQTVLGSKAINQRRQR